VSPPLFRLLVASAAGSLGNPTRTRLERRRGIVQITLVLDTLLHRFRDATRDVVERAAAAVRTGTRPSPGPVIGGLLRDVARSRRELIAENMLLRQQLIVAARRGKKPGFAAHERGLLVALAHFVPGWRDAVLLVKPETVLRWHRAGFRLFWRAKSSMRARGVSTRRTPPETVELIRRLAKENPLWGAERIRGELLKVGIHVAKRTIQKYMRQARGPHPWGQSWSTFLENHLHQIWACDLLQLCDIWFRPIFAFFIVDVGSRKVVHLGVTRSPSATWVAQQLRNATPFATGPRFIIRDNDDKFGLDFERAAKAAGIRVVRTAVKAPRMNSFCERFLGSVRWECLDHVMVLGEEHLHRVLGEYCFVYFNRARPHQGIGQLVPMGSSSANAGNGPVTARAVLNGLHHDYRRAA
jgi:transposase InsO family protein